ncbi:hypothetical protein ACXWPL_09485, partial [Streptococcus pyogenes]
MHGNELAIHDTFTKTVLTSDLNQGHALAVADFLKPGQNRVVVGSQIVAGWREPNKENKVG